MPPGEHDPEPEPPPPSARRRRWPGVVGLVLIAGMWLAAAVLALLSARADIRSGQRAIDRAREGADLNDLTSGRPLTELRLADERFDRAHDRLASPILQPARLLPFLGRQLRSAQALAGTASETADAAADGVQRTQRLLDGPHPPGMARVELLEELAALARDTDARLAEVDLGPRKGLVAPLAQAYNDLARTLADVREGLDRGASGAEAAASFLGGPRRYLVLAANNAEMRAGSGMFLQIGELQTGAGRLTLTGVGPIVDVPVPPGVPLEGDLADRWGWLHPNEDFRNLMLSPRFDASAALAVQMWEAAGRPPVDGVLALDPVLLQALLGVLGPVRLGEVTITADNVLDELLHDQYLRFRDRFGNLERREQLGSIVAAVIQRTDGDDWDAGRLATQLVGAARGRHLLAWSRIPAEQAGFTAAAVDGALHPDSLLVSLLNRGGNKLDPFVNVSAALDLVPATDQTEATLRVTLRNRSPRNQPPYIIGPHPELDVAAGTYVGILAVTLPGAAADGRIEGIDQLTVAGADGPTRVVGTTVEVARGETSTFVLRFRLPATSGALRVEPSARHPTVRWRAGDRTWRDEKTRTVTFSPLATP